MQERQKGRGFNVFKDGSMAMDFERPRTRMRINDHLTSSASFGIENLSLSSPPPSDSDEFGKMIDEALEKGPENKLSELKLAENDEKLGLEVQKSTADPPKSPISHDEVALRMSMLCQFLQDKEKPISVAHRNLCAEIGDIVGYEEFEFWFLRFENGFFDLGYDMSLEAKSFANRAESSQDETDGLQTTNGKNTKRSQSPPSTTTVTHQSPQPTTVPAYRTQRNQGTTLHWMSINKRLLTEIAHFETFTVYLKYISDGHAVALRDILIKSPNFQAGSIMIELSKAKIAAIKEKLELSMHRDGRMFYPIPDSNAKLEFEVCGRGIHIVKFY